MSNHRTNVTNEQLDERLQMLETQAKIDGGALAALKTQAVTDGARLKKIEGALFDDEGHSVIKEIRDAFNFSATTLRIIKWAAPVGAAVAAVWLALKGVK